MASVPRIIPNIVEIHFRYLDNGNQCENVFQYSYTVVPTAAVLLSLATAFSALFLPIYQAMQHALCVYTSVVANDIGAAGRATATYTQPANTHGTLTNNPRPGNVAMSLVGYTGVRGRANRARKEISGFVDNWFIDDQAVAGLMTLLINFGVAWLTKLLTGAFVPVAASMKNQSSHPLTAVASMDNYSDSAKTRLHGHGA